MTMYNTRFGMQSKTYFPHVSFVCVCIIGKTYISVSTYIVGQHKSRYTLEHRLFEPKFHHSFIPLVVEEGKERIKYLLPLGSCQDTTDLRRRSQNSHRCGPSPTTIKRVEHRQLFSRGRKSRRQSGAPTYDSIV